MEMQRTLKTKINEKEKVRTYAICYQSSKRQSSQDSVVFDIDTKNKEINLDPNFTPYAKVNSKLIRDLNVRANIIKFLEKNIRQKISFLEFGRVL